MRECPARSLVRHAEWHAAHGALPEMPPHGGRRSLRASPRFHLARHGHHSTPAPGVIVYASRTGTRRNLAAMRAAGWRIMVSARGVLRTEGFRYALDNGAWTAFQKGEAFDAAAFDKAVRLLGPGADFIVLPDIVMGGDCSLDMSMRWLRKLRRRKALRGAIFLIAVQNGMDRGQLLGRIKRSLGRHVGVFIGGDTGWKEATAGFWSDLAHTRDAICHMGRVNTARRMAICATAAIDSVDGSSGSRFAKTIPLLDLASRQTDLEGYLRRLAA
jgi:hypothetical protein